MIRYHYPPFVKHVLAPQNEFGIQKILGKFTKVLGFGKTPPPHVGKNSQIISFFFFDSVPNEEEYQHRRTAVVTAVRLRVNILTCECNSIAHLLACSKRTDYISN